MAYQKPHYSFSERFIERLWDAWCIVSIVGIWPRFIEPALLKTTHLTLPISSLPQEFDGLRIVQISDLHHTLSQGEQFLNRIAHKIALLNPDLIAFTGDLICYSHIEEPDLLKQFLKKLQAPLGTYAIFGNHDYAEFVSRENNAYQKVQEHIPPLMKGLYRLFSQPSTATNIEVTESIEPNAALIQLYRESNVTVLDNETIKIGSSRSYIQLTGLGDIAAKQCDPQKAFREVNERFPVIVLSHNPDSYSQLAHYPGDLLLFGHTHGGQVNIPYIWQKIIDIQDKRFKSGLFFLDKKFLYVNRGLGAPFSFRWFAPPEIALFTLVPEATVREMSWEEALRPESIPKQAQELGFQRAKSQFLSLFGYTHSEFYEPTT